MSNSRDNYFFLDSQDKISLPSNQEVRASDLAGKPFILIPDNNVCIHVSENNLKNQDKIKRLKVNNFLNYCQDSNITIIPDYGLIERASRPGTLELDRERLAYSENRFWTELGHCGNNDRLSSMISSIAPLKVLIHLFYAYLLQIKLILSQREPSRANVKINLQDLFNFSKEIGINLLLPWQFALAIFGGETELNRFISPKKGDVFKSLWGAAWDLFYLQLIHEHNGIREKGKDYFPRFILVTDDKACSTIGNLIKVSTIFHDGKTVYNGVMMNFDFPHLISNSDILHEMTTEMNFDALQRSISRSSMSDFDYQNDIDKIIIKSDNLISEITHKIKLCTKKGFG